MDKITIQMRETWKNIPGAMFDFEVFYRMATDHLLNECRVAEIGNADGKSAIFLAETLSNQGKNFDLRMIDSLDYGKHEQLTEILTNVQRSGLSEKIKFYPLDSLQASCKFPDEYFHFVFLDSSHSYEMTKAEIRLWFRKVMPNCMLGGHDYFSHEGVRQAVDEVIPAKFINTMPTVNGNGVWYVFKKDGAYVN